MKCEDVTNELISYAGGRADATERRELERHAAGCAECRTRMEQFSALSSVLDELPAVEPSFGFDARVRQRVAAEPQRGWFGNLIPQPRLALSAAVLMLLAVWVVKMQPLRQGPPAPVAQTSTQQEDFNAIQDLGVLENYDVVTKMDALSELVPATAQQAEKPGYEFDGKQRLTTEAFMLRRFLQFGPLVVLILGVTLGFAAQNASAQNGPRPRPQQARRQEARREQRAAANGAKNQPGVRAIEGLPPVWVQKLRDMPPEQQQRFLENNEQFKRLAPQRQEQLRRNLDNWNKLSPDEKQEAVEREQVLERMTPEQRAYVRDTLLPKWQSMPQDRRQAINRHLGTLRNMSPATQQAALNDPKFMQGLSPDEQSMLRDLNSLRNPPTP